MEFRASIKDLAKLAVEGNWHYIDVSSSTEAERIFVEEFEAVGRGGVPQRRKCTCGP